MEKTDRELLIKEISSRLPYGIKVQVFGWDEEKGEVAVLLKVYSINTDGYISLEYNHYDVESVYIEDCLLYLRPMSSMTEEEEKELHKISNCHLEKIKCYNKKTNCCDLLKVKITNNYTPFGTFEVEPEYSLVDQDNILAIIDYLNSHHFDYRGLIEKGLAIEAPKGMYK